MTLQEMAESLTDWHSVSVELFAKKGERHATVVVNKWRRGESNLLTEFRDLGMTAEEKLDKALLPIIGR